MRDKRILRRQLLAARQAMSREEVAGISEIVTQQLLTSLHWPKVSSLHIYLPLPNEVDTQPLLQTVWRQYPAIKTASWQKVVDTYQAWWFSAGGFTEPVASYTFDVIIVPMLGFTSSYYRLGRGGGFYDRFLATQPQAYTVGVCYESGRCRFIPEPHDLPMHAIVTEKTSYQKILLGGQP